MDPVLRQCYRVADAVWQIAAASPAVLACAAPSFPAGAAALHEPADFSLHVHVDAGHRRGIAASPTFRGRDHLVLADYGAGTFVLDLRRRVGFGVVSPQLAANPDCWRERIFPVFLGLLSLVLDTVPLHAACLERRGRGLLIAGTSGAGKSTLAATLASQGLAYVSDDWVYFTRRRGPRIHAAPVAMKLLPDATRFFPQLSAGSLSRAMNGELSFALDPELAFGAARVYSCTPHTIILLDRVPGAPATLRTASKDDLELWFSEPLDCVPDCFLANREQQLALLRSLAQFPSYVLACDGSPAEIAATVLRVCEGDINLPLHTAAVRSAPDPLDLLRRQAATPYFRRVAAADVMLDVATDIENLPFPSAPDSSPADLFLTLIEEPARWQESASASYLHGDLGFSTLPGGGCMVIDFGSRFAFAYASRQAIEDGSFAAELLRLWHQGRRPIAAEPAVVGAAR